MTEVRSVSVTSRTVSYELTTLTIYHDCCSGISLCILTG